ncbi:MAG: MgtC/SapB family protein [Calothrix sp. C42_A2020_038]|nr:MgtC/SapB family protein [Calothrix sp. C42_A2020_038]
MNYIEFAIPLGLAFLLGSAIGMERQWRQRMAGLQTNALVAVGAALFLMLSDYTPGDTRIPAQIVSGVGFLGGGVILREGHGVRGINTAATLWCTAAIGCLVGAKLYTEAISGTTAILIINIILRPLANLINQQPIQGTEIQLSYRCSIITHSEHEAHVRALLMQAVNTGVMKLRSLQSEDIDVQNKVEVKANLVTQDHNHELLEQMVSQLSLQPQVSAVSWEVIEEAHHSHS